MQREKVGRNGREKYGKDKNQKKNPQQKSACKCQEDVGL